MSLLNLLPCCFHFMFGEGTGNFVEGKKEGQFSSVAQLCLFVTPWTAARQASLSIINSWSLLKFTSIESVMPSNNLILCHLLLLPPSIFPSIRVFSNESVLHSRWPKYWSFSFNINPSSEYSGLSPCSQRDSQESSPTPQFESRQENLKLSSLLSFLLFSRVFPGDASKKEPDCHCRRNK